MTKLDVSERSPRRYTAPKLLRPDARMLSPEGKPYQHFVETQLFNGVYSGPS